MKRVTKRENGSVYVTADRFLYALELLADYEDTGLWPEEIEKLKTERKQDVGLRMSVYDEEEIHHGCTVQILRNSVTGEQSIGWWHEDTPPETMGGEKE